MKRIDVTAQSSCPLEKVYAIFAAPVPRAIDGCPCCIETRGADALLTTPLRDIGGMLLWRYVSGAFLTVGGITDFRYLLPRILDIALNDPEESNSIEIVLGKLRLAGWEAWPETERSAIIAVIDAMFDAAVARGTAYPEDPWLNSGDAEAVLCGAACADLDPRRWLARLTAPLASPVLGDLCARFPAVPKGFWEDAPAGHAIVARWLAELAPETH